MDREVLYEQEQYAFEIIKNTLLKVERAEKSFLSKQGSTSQKKQRYYFVFSAVFLLIMLIFAIVFRNYPFGIMGEPGLWILLAAFFSTSAFVGIQVAKVILNRKYYEIIFQGIELTNKIKKYLEAYQEQLNQRSQNLSSARECGWRANIKRGWDFQAELRKIEGQIAAAEKRQTEFLDKYALAAYIISSITVGFIETGLLRDVICEPFNINLGYPDWLKAVYAFTAVIGVVGGTLAMSYFWIGCKHFKMNMKSLIWIFTDGMIGFAVALLVACVIGGIVAFLIALVKLIWAIIKATVIFAGICFAGAAFINRNNGRR